MDTTSGKETIIVLRRLIAYSEKIFQLSKDIVTLVSDRREKPRISTAAVVKSSLVLFWARMGPASGLLEMARGPVIHPRKAMRITLHICLLVRNASTLL